MDIIEQLIEAGYQKEVEKLQSMVRKSIHLITDKSKEENFLIGETKIGGEAHLPKDFVWPMYDNKPLAFIAQINLSEITQYDTMNVLPKEGILSFFFEGGEKVWGFDPKDIGGSKVFYLQDIDDLERTAFPNGLEEDLIFEPCKVNFECRESYPTDLYALNQIMFNGDMSEKYDDFFDILCDGLQEVTTNKMFGYPDLIQGDIFLEAQLVSNGLYCGNETGYNDSRAKELELGVTDWMLLFQIDSDPNAGMFWGDQGRVYFVIKKQDVVDSDFNNAWALLQCG